MIRSKRLQNRITAGRFTLPAAILLSLFCWILTSILLPEVPVIKSSTLLRSAAAFGFDGVLLSDGCASVWAPKTLRASMGAAVRIPVIEAGKMPEAIAALRAKGITCLAAALYKSQPLSAAEPRYPGGVCVVIGSEGQGLTEETIRACNGTVRIPMTDRVESLNAGIAGSILLWHFREESL